MSSKSKTRKVMETLTKVAMDHVAAMTELNGDEMDVKPTDAQIEAALIDQGDLIPDLCKKVKLTAPVTPPKKKASVKAAIRRVKKSVETKVSGSPVKVKAILAIACDDDYTTFIIKTNDGRSFTRTHLESVGNRGDEGFRWLVNSEAFADQISDESYARLNSCHKAQLERDAAAEAARPVTVLPNEDDTMSDENGNGKKKLTTFKKAKAAADKAKKGVKEGAGRLIGKTSGLGITLTWNKHLMANRTKHLTDEALYDLMSEEFPDKDKMQPVTRVRAWANAGRYGFSMGQGIDERVEDSKKCIQYGEDGKPARGAAKKEEKKGKKKLKAKKKMAVVD